MTTDAPFPPALMDAAAYVADADRCHACTRPIKRPGGRATRPARGRDGIGEIGEIKSRRMSQRRAEGRRRRFSVEVGATFGDGPLPPQRWRVAVWSVTDAKDGISPREPARAAGVAQKSAWCMRRRIRPAVRTGAFLRLKGGIGAGGTCGGGSAGNEHAQGPARAGHQGHGRLRQDHPSPWA